MGKNSLTVGNQQKWDTFVKENGINKAMVLQILEESGLGMPEYYKWRSRSGQLRRNRWASRLLDMKSYMDPDG